MLDDWRGESEQGEVLREGRRGRMSLPGVHHGQDEARLFPETVRKERPRHRFTATLRRLGLSFLAEKGRRVKSQCLLCVMGFFLSDQSANH